MDCFIGVDIGTTGTKSMLISQSGKILGHAYQGYPITNPTPNRSEQRAEDWWDALVNTVRQLIAGKDKLDRVRALSLSLQGGTLIPVDRDLRPLRNAIVWSDVRCFEQSRAFAKAYGESYLYEKTGWPTCDGLCAMQIAWLRQNEPETFAATDRFLSVPDYIAARLTGEAALDPSNAGINQLADIRKGAYDSNVLEFAGIDASKLGRIQPSATPIGYLTESAKRELGFVENVLVVTGAHDQYALALGAGLTGTGDTMIGSGTAWAITSLADEPHFETGFDQSVSAVSGKWGSMVSLTCGGASLDWLRNNIALTLPNAEPIPFSTIDQEAARRSPGANGLMFFPYFYGAAYPLKQEQCKAAFIGLDRMHDRFDMARAVMEGVSFQIDWALEQFYASFGHGKLCFAGGAAKSAFWTQTLADITGECLHIPTVADLSCVGAAMMAAIGCGAFADASEAFREMGVGERIVEPNPVSAKQYRERAGIFRNRAKALCEMYEL